MRHVYIRQTYICARMCTYACARMNKYDKQAKLHQHLSRSLAGVISIAVCLENGVWGKCMCLGRHGRLFTSTLAS